MIGIVAVCGRVWIVLCLGCVFALDDGFGGLKGSLGFRHIFRPLLGLLLVYQLAIQLFPVFSVTLYGRYGVLGIVRIPVLSGSRILLEVYLATRHLHVRRARWDMKPEST